MAEAGARVRGQTTDTRPHYPWLLGIDNELAMIIGSPVVQWALRQISGY